MSSNSRVVEVSSAESGVTTLSLNRPPVNAYSPQSTVELLDIVDALAGDASVRAVLLKGEGGRYCAGADVEVMSDHTRSTYREMRRWTEVQNAFERLEKPIVVAIERYALGGGAELALSCDVRVMGETAVFGLPEAALGMFPGGGGSQRLTRLVGTARAFWMMATGEKVPGPEALKLGIVNEVVPDDRVVTRAMEIAERFAAGPTRAIGLTKRLVYESWGRELPSGLLREGDSVFELLDTNDMAEGFASFREKREPRFTGT